MSDERVEIEIVLDDGSVQKGFAKIRKEGKKTGKSIKKSFTGGFKSLLRPLTSMRGQILGLGTALATAFAGRRILQAAKAQEDAVNSLNSALKIAGTFSEEASQSFQNLASALQAQTTIGDEAIIQGAALARTYVTTNEAAEELTKTALDFAEAADLSFTEAVRRLGRGVQGAKGDIANFAPEIRSLTLDQLKAGEATRLLGERFKGAAAAAAKTFSGALKQTENIFGDLLEQIGFLVTKSPLAIAVIKEIGVQFEQAAKFVEDFGKSGDFAKTLALDLIKIGFAINDFVIKPILVVKDVFLIVFRSIVLGVELIIAGLANVAKGWVKIAELVGVSTGKIGENIKMFGESSVQVVKDQFGSVKDAVTDSFTFDSAVAAEKYLERLRTFVETVRDPVKDAANNLVSAAVDPLKIVSFDDIVTKMQDSTTKMKASATSLATTLNATIGNGVSNAFVAFGQALATGENALASFGKVVLGVFGDILIQLGTQTLATGLGMSAVPILFGPQGPAAIAAGAGMLIAGGVLKGLSGGGGGGGGGASAPSGGGVASSAGAGELEGGAVATQVEDLERETPGTSVTVNVEGNVLDRRETGLELVDIINESFGSDGTVLASQGSVR